MSLNNGVRNMVNAKIWTYRKLLYKNFHKSNYEFMTPTVDAAK